MSHKVDDDAHDSLAGEQQEQGAPHNTTWRPIVVRHTAIWHPPTDVYQAGDTLIVLVEAAGMREHDFEIVLKAHTLTISGVRKDVSDRQTVAYYLMEIPRGTFRTELQLPWQVQRDQVSATYHDGLLRIELTQAHTTSIQVINVSQQESEE